VLLRPTVLPSLLPVTSRWWLGVALILGGVTGCDMLAPAEPLPAGATIFRPPPAYLAWWAETEACSGRTGRVEEIVWYVVPGAAEFMTPDGVEVGRWSRNTAGTRIVLAGDYQSHELVVRHEMLHALLDREDHPALYFVTRCQLTWASWIGGEE
jgi:hypothetical protein